MKTFIAAFCGALFLLGESAAFAQSKPISIRPGETATIKLDHGAAAVVRRSPAEPMSEFEAGLLREMQMTDVAPGTKAPGVPVTRDDVPADPPPVEAGVLRITFRQVPGLHRGDPVHSMLTIQNGYATGFRYRAVMHVGRSASPTDVCGVEPQLLGTEHWPYAIDSLDLSDLRLEQFDGARVPCE